jgi:hypothetical protein
MVSYGGSALASMMFAGRHDERQHAPVYSYENGVLE